MQPKTSISIQSRALGIQAPSASALLAMVGPCTLGTDNQPAVFGSIRALREGLGDGPLVEAASHALELYGNPVVCVKTATSTAGTTGTLEQTGDGTSVATVASGAAPIDDLDLFLLVTVGGTIGTAGIKVQTSLDGGRTMSAETALGTDTSYEFVEAGVTIAFAAGTLLAGDTVAVSTKAPKWNSTELAAALDGLRSSTANWQIANIIGPVTASDVTAIEQKFVAMAAGGKFRMYAANTRVPNVGESPSTYISAMTTSFASTNVVYGDLEAGAGLMVSSISARVYLRPINFGVPAFYNSLAPHLDAAAIVNGTVPIILYDDNGNPIDRCHDETQNPGLDDGMFTTLRTWSSYQGIYINNARIHSDSSSDFQYVHLRRVMNIGAAALQRFFDFRLSVGVLTNPNGTVAEQDLKEMEVGATNAMATQLLAEPSASAVQCVLSRDDNLLVTQTIHATARIRPLGYPKFIEVDLAFQTPQPSV